MKKVELIKKTTRYLLRELKHSISKKPYFLNFPTATLCNHKCVMCNIHEIRKKDEIGINDLEKILSDPLFGNIESIGLSGGEPFMKKDLMKVISVLLEKLVNLRHFSINSNGQLPNRIKDWLPLIKELCIKSGVDFNIVLSMDGVEEVHSEVRGRPNAWRQLEASFNHIKGNDMIPSILMTIHRRNYQDVFNVYAYCRKNGIIPYFGIATIIERLGNEDIYDQFSITLKNRYYIWEFLQNMSNDKGFAFNKRIWYNMLSYQLLYGLERKASCVAKNKGVYLSDNGKVSYCGVYDKELKPYGHKDLLSRFLDKNNDKEIRQKMLDKHCGTCMHDYQSKPTFIDIVRFFSNENKIPQFKKVFKGELYRKINSKRKVKKSDNKIKHILLYGWFGTETIGDKAIYASIINYFNNLFESSIKFTIVSKMIAYTERTLLELGYDDITIVDLDSSIKTIEKHDLFVYCGGPIMGYSDLYDHYKIVNLANSLGKYTMIFGAGFSPIKSKIYKNVALSFIEQNDIVVLRDKESFDSVNNSNITLNKTTKSVVTIDPAYIWVLDQKLEKPNNETPILGISFRVFPGDDIYSSDTKNKIWKRINLYIRIANEFITENNGKIVLIPMNTYHVGGDDRKALYQIKDGILDKEKVELLSGFYSPIETLRAFSKCDYLLGMRFHSSVFSNALSIPTVGVEYVLPKGKITSLFSTLGMQEYLINIEDLDYKILKEKLGMIIEKKEKIISQLNNRNSQFKKEYYEKLNSIFKNLNLS